MTTESFLPISLNLDSALGHEIVDRRMEILHQVQRLGSISAAARHVGISYKAAWQALDTLGNLAGQSVVQSALGGVGGGGASLTAAGVVLLQAYASVRAARQAVLQAMPGTIGGVSHLGTSVGTEFALLGWRTSMRNQLPCEVVDVDEERSLSLVQLRLPDQQLLFAQITSHSAQLLGLTRGLPVIAMFKATAVQICRHSGQLPSEQHRDGDKVNCLAGKVVAGQEGENGAEAVEITIELGQGQRIVGISDKSDKAPLQTQHAVFAKLQPSGVVLVLPA